MKKFLITVIFVLTMMFNVYGSNPILIDPINNDTIESIYINLPAKLHFYDVESYEPQSVVIRFTDNNLAKELYFGERINYEYKNNKLYIRLKNYTTEELSTMNPEMIKVYLPSQYSEKVKPGTGFTIKNTPTKKKDDSGNSTN